MRTCDGRGEAVERVGHLRSGLRVEGKGVRVGLRAGCVVCGVMLCVVCCVLYVVCGMWSVV